MSIHIFSPCEDIELTRTESGDYVIQYVGADTQRPWHVGCINHDRAHLILGAFPTQQLAVWFAVHHVHAGAPQGQETSDRPRVLAVTDQGITRLYMSEGVDAVAIHLGLDIEFDPEEIRPVNARFQPLLEEANVSWPICHEGAS